MKEKLISRVGRIISGSVHSLIDSLENSAPETVLSESIREIESAIDDVQNELGLIVAKKHLATSKLMEENKKHEDLSEKTKIAIKENRDDLAEAAIARQLDIEAQIPILETTVDDCKTQEKELENYIHALQAKKREMKEELIQFRKTIKEAAKTSGSGGSSETPERVESKIAKAESAFERVIEKATGIPGSNGISERKSAAQLAELEEIARKNKIRERLSKIKGDHQ
ncbi:PspA/IM30 family protein [Desulfobacula toluolica]|uniref:Suppressor of sigma54-dependent transcription n=1 Tax=Desulfobacula toluolica (strain DSM 7467 / Tol2) TaxID=651182 RepID=K0NE63_DESTT|nr:PspA/IM30 family protein [Desulfobacula toluolica]CCK79110.1 suppressor of sigma54-dependent transcription [Desulfobacula toluolica Tol2]